MKTKASLPLLLCLAIGCAHHRDVRPGDDGIHRVVIQAEDVEAGSREAISQAQNYCEESGKDAVIVQEDKKYVGSMKEDSYNTAKQVSKAAAVVGGSVWALGGQNESNVGGVVGLGGAAANQALGKGYTVEMKFKCKPKGS